jgi:hypothetical protein
MVVAAAEEHARLAELDAALAEAKKKLAAITPHLKAAQQQWEADIASYGVTLPELAEGAQASDADKKRAK